MLTKASRGVKKLVAFMTAVLLYLDDEVRKGTFLSRRKGDIIIEQDVRPGVVGHFEVAWPSWP